MKNEKWWKMACEEQKNNEILNNIKNIEIIIIEEMIMKKNEEVNEEEN